MILGTALSTLQNSKLLGYSVTVSTTVFEIVSLGSSPDTPAKFICV